MSRPAPRPTEASVRRLEPSEPADAELVARIQGGDRWAEEALYRRHVDVVAATALRLLRNRSEAEDVVQETFLLALEKIAQLRDGAAVRGWLLRIAVSRVHRRFRWRKLWAVVGRAADDDCTFEAEATRDASPELRADLRSLDLALAKVRERERTAWVLRYVVGCSLDEVALASGCSLAAAKRRIATAAEAVTRYVGVEAIDERA